MFFLLNNFTVLFERTMFGIQEHETVLSPWVQGLISMNLEINLEKTMKLKQHAVALGCLAALGLAGTAQAFEVSGNLLEVYGTLYPEYNKTSYTDGVAGSALSTMNAGLVAPGLSKAATKISKDQINWSQSYIGVKGIKAFGDVTVGYDFQGVMAPNKTLDSSIATNSQQPLFGDTRDAFVSIAHKNVGIFQFGQMDTIYKEYGDRIRMLGVSSSNFTSTSGVLSGVGWKGATGAGTTSFNTRVGNQIRWESPVFSGFQAGLSYRPDPNRTAGQDQSLTAMALRWSQDAFYASVQREVHNDYHSFSGTGLTALAAANVYNLGTARSKDTATRATVGYKNGPLQVAADFARLEYTEEASATGKFSGYTTNTWQVSTDYAVNADWNLAANYASNGAGSCTLLGGAACSTTGQGGTLLSLGAKYNYDKNIGIFAMYGLNKSNASASFASSNTGANTTNLGVGVLIKF